MSNQAFFAVLTFQVRALARCRLLVLARAPTCATSLLPVLVALPACLLCMCVEPAFFFFFFPFFAQQGASIT